MRYYILTNGRCTVYIQDTTPRRQTADWSRAALSQVHISRRLTTVSLARSAMAREDPLVALVGMRLDRAVRVKQLGIS